MVAANGQQMILLLTMAFSLAFALGYLVQRLGFSPILGYLVTGYVIGPYSPGFVANTKLTEQLAEIGIVLLMFGVGIHFSWRDLLSVRAIAIPGAILQTLVAASLGTAVMVFNGASLGTGLVVGLAIGVASTVVLVRMLADHNLLQTAHGHIAVGWLIVEDLITVLILLLLPSVHDFFVSDNRSLGAIATTVGMLALRLCLLAIVLYFFAHTIAQKMLVSASRTRSSELLTLAVLALVFVVATGVTMFFGISLALGAFISGVVVGRTDAHHQAAAITLPMKDAFAALFFISVGMLFNPADAVMHIGLLASLLAIILIAKPLTAFLLVNLYSYPLRTSLIVAVALAQIGEFSFILAEEAWRLHIIRDEAYDLLVACAFASIAINPFLFQALNTFKIRDRHDKNQESASPLTDVVVVGFAKIGQRVANRLKKAGIHYSIVDQNVDIILAIKEYTGQQGIYGDAANPNILEMACIKQAKWLVITVPDIATTTAIIHTARHLNPSIKILARAQYLDDVHGLKSMDVQVICCEKESAIAFQEAVGTSICGFA